MFCEVTPLVGVWIETENINTTCEHLTSLPSWECGLKLDIPILDVLLEVTPLVGVWIETERLV